jgi:hypothetical protein
MVDKVEKNVSVTSSREVEMIKFSAQGISILRDLATLSGDQEQRDKIGGTSSDLNTSTGIWLKVRKIFGWSK